MYPEAGGSSSFARRAFNEFASFFAAWAQMLNYTITIAISAFFVPHYFGSVIGVDALRDSPGDIFFGIGVVIVLSAVNIVGVKESAGVNVALAVTDFLTQLLLVIVGLFLVFSPQTLVDNVVLGVAPTWKDFFLAIPVGMIAYTGIETISNMAEEAKDETKTIPAAINRVVIAVFAIYALLPMVALSALPVTQNADGSYTTLLGEPEDKGGYAGDPILGVVKQLDLGIFQHAGEIYVGLLAATILFIATNAGIIGVSRLVYSMGLHRQVPDRLRQLHPKFGTPWIGIIAVRRDRLHGDDPGPGRLPGEHVRVRRDAVVHDRAHLGHPAAQPLSGLHSPVPRAGQHPHPRLRDTAVRALRWHRHRPGLHRRHRAACRRGVGRPRLADPRLHRLPDLSPPPGTGSDVDRQGRDPRARDRARGRVRVDPRRAGGQALLRGRHGDGDQGRGAAAARHPRAGHDHRSGVVADRRLAARAGARRPGDHRAGQAPGRPARDRALREDPCGRSGQADRRRGARDGSQGDRAPAAGARRLDRVRQDGGDRAGRAPLPGHHPGRPGDAADRARTPPARRRSIRSCPAHATSTAARPGSCPR